MATQQEKPGSKAEGAVKPESSSEKEIHTDEPLSEKDEVKQAEKETNKPVKK